MPSPAKENCECITANYHAGVTMHPVSEQRAAFLRTSWVAEVMPTRPIIHFLHTSPSNIPTLHCKLILELPGDTMSASVSNVCG